MKCLFKWAFRLLFLAVVLVVAAIFFKDAIIKAAVERQIRANTGMDVKIGRFSVSVFSPVATIEDFKLYNRPEFGGTPFLDIPELHVEYDRAALAERKLRFTLMRFNLAELTVVRNEAGQTNLVAMMARAREAKAERKPRSNAEDIEFAGIDVLNLSLGHVRYLDLKERENSWDLNLALKDQVFRNVKSEGDFVGVLLMTWLRNGASFSVQPIAPSTVPAATPVRAGRK